VMRQAEEQWFSKHCTLLSQIGGFYEICRSGS